MEGLQERAGPLLGGAASGFRLLAGPATVCPPDGGDSDRAAPAVNAEV